VSTAGAVLDHDQRVDPPEQHGVHMDEVDREDPVGLGGQELLPRRARVAGRGIDPGVVQDLPDGGGRNLVAEPDELASNPPVPPAGFSVAIRITSFLIAAAVDGRPGRRRLA
jgi:hypothetical protein